MVSLRTSRIALVERVYRQSTVAMGTILLVLGVMNLLWVAAISVFVLLEKVTPYGRAIARITGVVVIRRWGEVY